MTNNQLICIDCSNAVRQRQGRIGRKEIDFLFRDLQCNYHIVMSAPKSLPPGWSCHISQSTGRNYYFNQKTGASVWDISELQGLSSDRPKPEPSAPPSVRTSRDSSAESALEDPEDLSEDLSDAELQNILKQRKIELEMKMKRRGLTLLDCQDEDISPSSSPEDGLRSGIGSKLRRKVNRFYIQSMDHVPKKIKVESQDSFSERSNVQIENSSSEMEGTGLQYQSSFSVRERVGDENPGIEIQPEQTDCIESEEEEEEENLYGADELELEDLRRLKEQFT